MAHHWEIIIMKKGTIGIDKYSTFGLREIWLEQFFEYGDGWLDNVNLGPRQVPAVANWLSEAKLIDKKTKKTTELAKDLKIIYNYDPFYVWGIIWINLYYNSRVVNWYCDNLWWRVRISRAELLKVIMDDFPMLSKGTLHNAISALINMFDNSPLNEAFNLGILEKKGRAVKFIIKYGVTEELDMLLVAYSLYQVKQHESLTNFEVGQLYDKKFQGGPYKLFGVSQSELEIILEDLKYDGIIEIDCDGSSNRIVLNEKISLENLIKFKKDCFI